MNSRERVLAILNREPVDRIPVDIWCTPEILAALRTHFGVDARAHDELELYSAMGIDKIVWLVPDYTGPTAPVDAPDEVTDHWGVRSRVFQAGKAQYSERCGRPPLADCATPAAVRDYPWWPDPEQFDYEKLASFARRAASEFVTVGPWISLFEIYIAMRGMEQALMDLYTAPELAHAILERIQTCQNGMLERMFERLGADLDLIFLSDDMGCQQNLMIPLEAWDTFFRQRMHDWCGWFHEAGKRVFYHSDGAVAALVPRLIDAGIDILNPIQHACPGMEMRALKARFGERLVFHGGVDNQRVLPFGTADDVRRETRECLRALGSDGGYICASCHNIQAGTPLENILAMIDTVKQEGSTCLRTAC